MAGIFVPKNRKPKFELSIRILDLNNVPLKYGAAYVKWHIPSLTSAEHRGRTDKAYIKDHKAVWDYHKVIPMRLTIDKAHNLQECVIAFEVVQEYFGGARDGRITLGAVRLNLAEYTQGPDLVAAVVASPPGQGPAEDGHENEEGMITRRYLMQDSKINATLKLGIRMKQTEGDTNFVPPALKSAMVIGGIAGIMNAEAGESEDMPSLTSKSREISEQQDIYRRNLAASWACQGGELPPDRLIEDLFAGGDGGSMDPPPTPQGRSFGHAHRHRRQRSSMDGSTSDSDSRRTIRPDLLSPESARSDHRRNSSGGQHDYATTQSSMSSTISGRGSIEQQIRHSNASRQKRQVEPPEVTEYDLRDDLRSWQVQVN